MHNSTETVICAVDKGHVFSFFLDGFLIILSPFAEKTIFSPVYVVPLLL